MCRSCGCFASGCVQQQLGLWLKDGLGDSCGHPLSGSGRHSGCSCCPLQKTQALLKQANDPPPWQSRLLDDLVESTFLSGFVIVEASFMFCCALFCIQTFVILFFSFVFCAERSEMQNELLKGGTKRHKKRHKMLHHMMKSVSLHGIWLWKLLRNYYFFISWFIY